MKRLFYLTAIAIMAMLSSSCDKVDVPHTGDTSGNLYGVWALQTKTEVSAKSSDKEPTTKEVDYSSVHFYLAFGEVPFPHAIAKKGSFTSFDLDDVDVDAVTITYNADQKKISFKDIVWLSDQMLTYNMILEGTFDVLELTDKKFVIEQGNSTVGTTTYSFTRFE